MIELLIEPPDIQVPALRAVIESVGSVSLCLFTKFTSAFMSSVSFGYTTSSGLISKRLASFECDFSVSSLKSTSPLMIDFISSICVCVIPFEIGSAFDTLAISI